MKAAFQVVGSEEPLGLRLQLAGIATVMLPTIYDPSELRSEFNGKALQTESLGAMGIVEVEESFLKSSS